MEAETTRADLGIVLNLCGSCKESLQGRHPSLLPCLHTFCQPCLTQALLNDGVICCPTCQQRSNMIDAISNEFVPAAEPSVSQGDGNKTSEEEVARVCTGCEENVPATSHCVECAEFLCDQCVQAHRRVKITKEHTIQGKDEAPREEAGSGAAPLDKMLTCSIHKIEPLKLYCDTCDRLTCRDCQLLGHKEHRYSFVTEASDAYKVFLQTQLGKMRERQGHIVSGKALYRQRIEEISQREKQVANDVKDMVYKVTDAIGRRGKQLLSDLNSVCAARKSELAQKQRQIETLSSEVDHASQFMEFMLDCGNVTAMMHSKKVLVDRVKHVLGIKRVVPNPEHVVDIRVQFDEASVLSFLSQQGQLIVDRVAYGSSASTSGSAVAGAQSRGGDRTVLSQHQRMALAKLRARFPSIQNWPMEKKTQLLATIANMKTSHSPVHSPSVMPSAPRFPTASSNTGFPPQFAATAGQSNMVTSTHRGNPSNGVSYHGNTKQNSLINLRELHRRRMQQQQMQQQQQQLFAGADLGGNNHGNVIVIEPAEEDVNPQPSSTVHPVPAPSHRNRFTPLIDLTATNAQHQLQLPSVGGSSSAGGVGVTPAARASPGSIVYSRQSSTDSGSSTRPTSSQAGYDEVVLGTAVVKHEARPSPDAANFSLDADPSTYLADWMRTREANGDGSGGGVTASSTVVSQVANSTVASPPAPEALPDTTPTPPAPDAATADNTTPTPSSDLPVSVSPVDDIGLRPGEDEATTPVDVTDLPEEAPPGDLGPGGSGGFEPFPLSRQDQSIVSSILASSAAADADAPVPSPGKGREMYASMWFRGPNGELSKWKGPASMALVTSNHAPDDPSEDYCACCRNGGDLLCCDKCPKVYHLQCHVPVLSAQPSSESWVCGLCIPDYQIALYQPDSRGEESYPVGTKRKVAVGLTNKELQVCERILLEMFAHELSVPFHEPVSKTLVPDYYQVITNPMDLMKIRQKLSRTHFNHYDLVEEFLADVRQIFVNCAKYNAPDSEVGQMGRAVEQHFEELVERLLTYIDLRAHTPSSVKSEGAKPKPKKLKLKHNDLPLNQQP